MMKKFTWVCLIQTGGLDFYHVLVPPFCLEEICVDNFLSHHCCVLIFNTMTDRPALGKNRCVFLVSIF